MNTQPNKFAVYTFTIPLLMHIAQSADYSSQLKAIELLHSVADLDDEYFEPEDKSEVNPAQDVADFVQALPRRSARKKPPED